MSTTDTQALTFPPRILELLRDVANRTPPEGYGPWEDGNGEPLQDDADAALAWIASAQPAPQVSMPELWSVEVQGDGRKLVSIGNDWLAGEGELTDEQTNCIIGAAKHLLSFVGYGLPPSAFDPDDASLPLAGDAPLQGEGI